MLSNDELSKYRNNSSEIQRIEDLIRIIKPITNTEKSVIDIGARDGFLSKQLLGYYERVVAFDLQPLTIFNENISWVRGDIAAISFKNNSFDLVVCVEVLEHIPPIFLQVACSELSRICKQYLLIGVPYKQDLRIGRTKCCSCGKRNPPWGHANSFDKTRLMQLFPKFKVVSTSFVDRNDNYTNFMSTLLMDLAGNPYGTYSSAVKCIYCGEELINPPERNFLQKVLTRLGFYFKKFQKPFYNKTQPNWIHLLFEKI
ncbi:MAG: class I SAM-dependent methyltransferase [Thermodesulfobacteriota bacterium]|nr:class I SAM-dependent methyltransferase [Thermodesulfobacteriota bacterium]